MKLDEIKFYKPISTHVVSSKFMGLITNVKSPGRILPAFSHTTIMNFKGIEFKSINAPSGQSDWLTNKERGYEGSRSFWRRRFGAIRFGADDLAPTIWRRTIWRRNFEPQEYP